MVKQLKFWSFHATSTKAFPSFRPEWSLSFRLAPLAHFLNQIKERSSCKLVTKFIWFWRHIKFTERTKAREWLSVDLPIQSLSISCMALSHRVRISKKKRPMSSALFGSFGGVYSFVFHRRGLCDLLWGAESTPKPKWPNWPYITIKMWKVPNNSDDICLFLLDIILYALSL